MLSSFSRPRVSNDNQCSEAGFKTLKHRPGYPNERFETIELAREWVSEFVHWYNNKHYHSGIGYLTPASRHEGKATEILNKRKMLYKAARELNTTDEIKELLNTKEYVVYAMENSVI